MPNNLLRFFWMGVLPLLFAHSGLAWSDSGAKGVMPPPPERQKALLNLMRQDCGSCHGLRFEGGLVCPLGRQISGRNPPFNSGMSSCMAAMAR